jgi:hypothetical protein
VISPTLLLLLRIALAIWDLLYFHMRVRINFSISEKSDIEILMVIVLNL